MLAWDAPRWPSEAASKAGHTVENCKPLQRHRRVFDEFLCPITQELPLEPVTAEGGGVDPFAADNAMPSREPDGSTRGSPVTNLPMMSGSRLVQGERAEWWKERWLPEERGQGRGRSASRSDSFEVGGADKRRKAEAGTPVGVV